MPLGMSDLITPGFLRRSAEGEPGEVGRRNESGNAVGMIHIPGV